RLMECEAPLRSCSGATTHTSLASSRATSSSTARPGASMPSSLVTNTRSSGSFDDGTAVPFKAGVTVSQISHDFVQRKPQTQGRGSHVRNQHGYRLGPWAAFAWVFS